MLEYIRLAPIKRIQVRLGTETLVDSTRGMVLYEGILPPRYFVPREDVKAELVNGDQTNCQHKGQWRQLDMKVGEKVVPGAAWCIYSASKACMPIENWVAFHGGKVDAILVD